MSLKGWAIALLLSPLTLGTSIPLYAAYWFLKKIGKWYIRGLKIFFLMPAAIVLYIIATIIEKFIGGSEWVVSIFTGGLKNMEVPEGQSTFISIPGLSQFKLQYILGFILAIIVDIKFFIQPFLSGGIPEFSFLTLTSFLSLGLPFFVLVVFSGAVNKYSGTNMTGSARELGAAGTAAGAGAAANAAAAPGAKLQEGMEGAKQAKGMYDDINEVGEMAEGLGGEGAAAGGEAAAAEGAEGMIAAVGGESMVAAGGPVALAAIVTWVYMSIIAFIISVILLAVTWGWMTQIAPVILGPIFEAAGVASLYGEMIGQSTSNTLGPQLDTAFEDEIALFDKIGARLGCVMKGPQCLRNWQMNNTVRPGSEDVGERYELRVVEFGLGVDRIDTAYKEKNYTLPVNFLVENTRNGIKGITAKDVQYKIELQGGDRTYCSTSGENGRWKYINSQGLQQGEAGFEENNNILPGLGVTPTQSLDRLNLANCELLQPSLGISRVLEMQMKYDYSSQTTLYFDAMSREHRRDEGIMPGFTKSQTARTPVQSYANVQGPASFYETAGGDRRSVPFTARFGFETGTGVDYRIDPDSIRIYDSTLTEPTDQCSGLKRLEDEGENVYTVSDRAQERIELRQEDGWFSSNIQPAPLRCTMQLSNPNSVSATGEELIMRMDANYTVRITEDFESFSVWNTQCETRTCPIVVPEQYAQDADINLTSECQGVDRRNGCSVRIPKSGSDSIDWARLNLAEDEDGDTVTIRAGAEAERALSYSQNFMSTVPYWEGIITEQVKNNPNRVIGTKSERTKELRSNNVKTGMVAYEGGRNENNLRYDALRGALCQQHVDYSSVGDTKEALEDYLNQWKEERPESGSIQPYFLAASQTDCTRSIAQTIIDMGQCEVKKSVSSLNAFFTLDADKFKRSKQCDDNERKVKRCTQGSERESGVLIETPNEELLCYGGTFGDGL